MAETFDITATHPLYDAYLPSWTLMRDAFEGEDDVKAKGDAYLPMKSGIKAIADKVKQQDAYNAYRLRAEFPELVAPTVRGLSGVIHSKPSTYELPKAMEYLIEKAAKDGQTLEQVHHLITAELLRVGRFGILAGVNADGAFHLAGYDAETITNWDGNDYLILNETAKQRDPLTNKWEEVKQYRECYLTDTGAYASRVWVAKTGADGKDEWTAGEEELATIKGASGLPFVPFVFAGTIDLSSSPDDVPLYGLAKLAVRAYRLDADYTNAMHMTSEPTPWVTGVAKENAPTSIGAGTLWVFPDAAASAGFLEFSGSGIGAQKEAIRDTLERAILFGAQLFADKTRSAESGEALRLRLGSQTATLRMIAIASAATLEKALRNIAIWDGLDPDQVVVKPNMEFVDAEMSPQEVRELVAAWQSGAYSKLTLYENLQRGGIANSERTFDDEQDLIDGEGEGLGMVEAAPVVVPVVGESEPEIVAP